MPFACHVLLLATEEDLISLQPLKAEDESVSKTRCVTFLKAWKPLFISLSATPTRACTKAGTEAHSSSALSKYLTWSFSRSKYTCKLHALPPQAKTHSSPRKEQRSLLWRASPQGGGRQPTEVRPHPKMSSPAFVCEVHVSLTYPATPRSWVIALFLFRLISPLLPLEWFDLLK